jgi:indole-3-glycerol phosphate synthase
MSDVLAKICADKRKHVEAVKRDIDLSNAPPVRGFKRAIQNKKLAVIAEIKKASPSKGVLRADFNPALHAKQYEAAGAACLSILTDVPYFQGADDYLMQGRAACSLPVLRKDFMVDVWQVSESRALGADCILIIMAAVDDTLAQNLYDAARALDMDVLIEVHDEAEMTRALNLNADDAMLGINNRNLKTMHVDLKTSLDLIRMIPADRVAISESGIHSRADLIMLQNARFQGFLIGESLMRQPDPGAALLTMTTEQS